jgi:hypothetical protein
MHTFAARGLRRSGYLQRAGTMPEHHERFS